MKEVIIFFFSLMSVLAQSHVSKVEPNKKEVLFISDFKESSFMVDVLNDYFELKLVVTPNAREWKLIEQNPNVCMLDRIKTDTRLQVAYFSRYPTNYDLPHVFLMKKKQVDYLSINIVDLVKNLPNFRIGLAKGYYYGDELNSVINTLPKKNIFMLSATQDPDRQLLNMLKLDRIDGAIIYSHIAKDYLSNKELMQFRMYEIEHVEKLILSYMVCSKSELGKQVIDTYDQIITQKKLRAYLLKGLIENEEWTQSEVAFLEQLFKKIDNSL